MSNKFEEVKQKLKEEFFGIDEQIDEVVKALETWVSIKDYQVRPMTVCLWGLTGTGKTALINKAIELLNLEKKKFYIKFGSKTSGLDEDFSENSCEDTIFILDEFQYFKTKREDGAEFERDEDNSTNIIWELLDGGIVNLYGRNRLFAYEKIQLVGTIYTLMDLDAINTKYNSGIVSHPDLASHFKRLHMPLNRISSIKYYKENAIAIETDRDRIYADDDEDPIIAYSETEAILSNLMQINWRNLYEYSLMRDIEYSFKNENDFIDFVLNLPNLKEVILFLERIRDAKPKLNNQSFVKSLIFIIGNLDECYTMSNELTSDLDADYFYKQTKKITLLNIRSALLKRFRSEQIARLGSCHIIYPSLNKAAFQAIIEKELNQIKKIVLEKFPTNIKDITFTSRIKNLIYKEGVFPVIGARSVSSMVTEIISDKLSHIINVALTYNEQKDMHIIFDYKKQHSIINISTLDCYNNIINTAEFKYEIKIDKLRAEKNKGKQTHIAVHEAGHAVCAIVLEHIFPEVVHSVVMNAKNTGFNLFNSEDYYFNKKKTHLNSIATMLAGYAAEEMIFGPENISNGSSSDINKATTELSLLYKNCGFLTDRLGTYVSEHFVSGIFETSNYSITDQNNNIERNIEASINKALMIARHTLHEQKTLFLKISEYLTKNPKITNKKLKELTKLYVKNITMSQIDENKEQIYIDKFNNEIKTIF